MEKAAKRLRGWELEIEKTKERPLPKGPDENPSNLATKLLKFWAHGQLPATAVQDLAHGAILDGAESDELGALGKAGHWGANKGSCHRDIMAHFCPQLDLCASWDIIVPCLDPKTSKETEETASILLPHMMFWQLGINHPEHFHQMFGTKDLAWFWHNVEHLQDDRLNGHPICLGKRTGLDKRQVQDKPSTIPIFCHGDGAEFQSRDSLMIWSWGGILNKLPSLQSHMLLACYPKSATTKGTWNTIQEWLTWSFEALLSGHHPEVGPGDTPLPKGSIFEAMKGEPLYQNYRCTIWSIQGDHEFYSLVLGLPHWGNASPCWECDAMNPRIKKKVPLGKSVKTLDEEQQAYIYVDNKAALAKGPSHPLFALPGVTSRFVRGDALHILFCKGVCSHVLGSLLHYLIYHDGKGKQKKPPSERLGLIFQEVQKSYKETNAPTKLTNLKLSMVVDPKKPHTQYPKLEAKGAETKYFCFSFLPLLQKLLHRKIEEERHMLEALETLCLLIDFYDRTSMFLSPQEFEDSRNLGKRQKAVSYCDEISYHAPPHKKWKVHKPKVYLQLERGRLCGPGGKVEPFCHCWCEVHKDFHQNIPKYRVLLHLQLTRPGFSQESIHDDE